VLHDTHGLKWRNIANLDEYRGIPPGTLCAIVKGRKVKKTAYRIILGLLALVSVAACKDCGEGHAARSCPKKRKPPCRMNRRAVGIGGTQ